jgi:hypothetical protein
VKFTNPMMSLLFGARTPVSPCVALIALGTAACSGQANDVALPDTEPAGLPLAAPPGDDVSGTLIDDVVDKDQCHIDRDDRGELLELGGGSFNPWPSCGAFCPADTYAYGVKVRSQAYQGSADDHAITGVMISCHDPDTGEGAGGVGLSIAKGSWGDWTMCPSTAYPMANAQLKYDGKTSGTDDFGATQLSIGCGNGTLYTFHTVPAKKDTDKGSWLKPGGGIFGPFCPTDEAVCGVEVSVGSDGSNDQAGVDVINFHCCEKD